LSARRSPRGMRRPFPASVSAAKSQRAHGLRARCGDDRWMAARLPSASPSLRQPECMRSAGEVLRRGRLHTRQGGPALAGATPHVAVPADHWHRLRHSAAGGSLRHLEESFAQALAPRRSRRADREFGRAHA
jgi:hypothetical protein